MTFNLYSDLLLLAHADGAGNSPVIERLLEPDCLIFIVGGIAVVVGGIVAVVKAFARHKERMTMIRMGMNPDTAGPQASEEGTEG
jgi:hypothetical protein